MLTKRLFDVALAIPGLLLSVPLLLVLALLVKLEDGGPVFFRQSRVGKNQKLFAMLKFRSMKPEREDRSAQLTVADDGRITRIGRWLRATKLDELPQLWHVVVGDMSLVGPRPEVPRYVEKYPEDLGELILSVPPGMTGLAALRVRDEAELLAASDDPAKTYEEELLPIKLNWEAKYVRERSLWMDIQLILETLRLVLKR